MVIPERDSDPRRLEWIGIGSFVMSGRRCEELHLLARARPERPWICPGTRVNIRSDQLADDAPGRTCRGPGACRARSFTRIRRGFQRPGDAARPTRATRSAQRRPPNHEMRPPACVIGPDHRCVRMPNHDFHCPSRPELTDNSVGRSARGQDTVSSSFSATRASVAERIGLERWETISRAATAVAARIAPAVLVKTARARERAGAW